MMDPDGPEERTAFYEESSARDAERDELLDMESAERAHLYTREMQMEDALRDIISGAQMMLDAPMSRPNWVADYITEVKRVAQAGLT
jgi:hypothetical protein